MSARWTLRYLAERWLGALTPGRTRTYSYDLHRLSRMLGVPPAELPQFRGARRDPRYHYRPLTCEKRDGSRRQLYAPSPPLKAMHRALLRRYLNLIPVHPAATGFRRGGSVADNARRHLGQAVVVTADIADFFDTTRAGRVRAFFAAQGWDDVATSVLTGLCTFRGALPQGAPTSPALSNLVNVALDEALTALVRRSGGTYTRYGDDLTFSWARDDVPASLKAKVDRALLDHGYRRNRAKGWRVYRVQRGDEPCVTGIRLGRDGRLHPPPEIARTMRRLRRRLRWRNDPDAAARLRGYEGYVEMLN